MKFIIESSSVPIYNRIAVAFAQTLMEFGHTVHFIDASGFNETDFVNTINDIDIDYYISTNELNRIQKDVPETDFFYFNLINKKKIFIHHDSIFSGVNNYELIKRKIASFQSSNNDSHHFCIESSNIELLHKYGITNAHKTYHATEFSCSKFNQEKFGISFVGHLMSGINLYPSDSLPGGKHLQSIAWSRYCNSSFETIPIIRELAQDKYFLDTIGISATDNNFAIEQYLVANLNKLSSAYRGEIISNIRDQPVDIIGGDLSYGRIKDPLLLIEQKNIKYHPATSDYSQTQHIYSKSRINLNISALQFDTAINNRIIDIIGSGGFILTDHRSDLDLMIESSNEITFKSPEELNHLIDFYMHNDNKKRSIELIDALQSEIMKKFLYSNSVSEILRKIQ
jgi:hypothetical protein